MIIELCYDDVKDIKIKEYGVDVINRGIYYGYVVDTKIVSILNIYKNKIGVNYTFSEYRGKGYFTKLLEEVIKKYKCTLFADCLESSYKIYKKLGFVETKVKEFKKFKVHYMKREYEIHNTLL